MIAGHGHVGSKDRSHVDVDHASLDRGCVAVLLEQPGVDPELSHMLALRKVHAGHFLTVAIDGLEVHKPACQGVIVIHSPRNPGFDAKLLQRNVQTDLGQHAIAARHTLHGGMDDDPAQARPVVGRLLQRPAALQLVPRLPRTAEQAGGPEEHDPGGFSQLA